jgi:Flp pilus assembly protein TadG
MFKRALKRLTDVATDNSGSVIVEFALLAPTFLTLLLGVVQIGLQLQNWNAVRNLASDGARFAVVEYQRDRQSAGDLIATWIRSRGVGSRYNLDTDRLGVTVTTVTSRIPETIEMDIKITYDAPDYLPFVDTGILNLSYERPVFLLKAS